jgi:hypothetical protein
MHLIGQNYMGKGGGDWYEVEKEIMDQNKAGRPGAWQKTIIIGALKWMQAETRDKKAKKDQMENTK